MRRLRNLGVVVALLCGLFGLRAQSPDDQFVSLYNFILQADALRESGRPTDARERYEQARNILLKLQAEHPNWNPKIVNYRLNYIAERIGPPVATPPAQTQSVPPALPPTQPTVPQPITQQPAATQFITPTPRAEDLAIPAPTVAGQRQTRQIAELENEVQGLKRERDILQAKLREALAVQPAAVDPRELARAESRLKELNTENERLRKDISRQQDKLAHAANPAALEAAQKALKEAQQTLSRQTNAINRLSREKSDLQDDLRKANERARARAPRTRTTPPASPTAPSSSEARVAELTQKLNETQRALAAEQSRSDSLRAEKETLEKRVATLSTASAPTAAAQPSVPSAGVAAPKPATVSTRRAKAAEKEKMRMLERERDDLRKRVNALTRELEDRRISKSTAGRQQWAEELSMLRTRVQVYEARSVPYTPEEMALFKQAASVPGRDQPSTTTRKTSRQIPAASAALVADAQRAVQGNRLDEAEQKFKQALSYDEKNVILLGNLSATYIDAGRLDDADATIGRALAVDPTDPGTLSLQGLLRFRQGKYDEAIDILGRAAQLDPDNPQTQNYLGVALSQKGQRGPAETALRRAVQLDANYAEAHHNLAIVYATQKPPFQELAKWHYRKALDAGHPKNPDLENLLQPAPAGGTGK